MMDIRDCAYVDGVVVNISPTRYCIFRASDARLSSSRCRSDCTRSAEAFSLALYMTTS